MAEGEEGGGVICGCEAGTAEGGACKKSVLVLVTIPTVSMWGRAGRVLLIGGSS